MFESRPAPPSYDDAMLHQPQPSSAMQRCNSEAECSSMESNGSEAPPYSEIHLDPVIPQPREWQQQLQQQSSHNQQVTVEIANTNRHHVPCGAALVLPCPAPPDFSQLNHVELPNSDSLQDQEQQGDPLPSPLRRMRARSREAIVLPRQERDAVLQRFSLQLNLSLSGSSSSSESGEVMNHEGNRRQRVRNDTSPVSSPEEQNQYGDSQ